ncbi:MAG: DNA polymerase III subunit alpha [Bacteroidales bacterium]|nr:DNA polymerase III subunit alpha [Bacteroidales bacterium]MBN2764310.1 DNA polymerase III subunit alpha [Bacteroidales bacterium]
MFLIFDTETTGLPANYNAPVTDIANWPRLVQIAWECHDEKGVLLKAYNYIIKPSGFTIPFSAEKIHGISTERALREGFDLVFVLQEFNRSLLQTKLVIGHNIDFDRKIVGAEYVRTGQPDEMSPLPYCCTKEEATEFCALLGGKGGNFKWPTLSELHQKLFSEDFNEAHNAAADVAATARCFLELLRLDVIKIRLEDAGPSWLENFKKSNPVVIPPVEWPDKNARKERPGQQKEESDDSMHTDLTDVTFTHLHLHTQYSILDGAADIRHVMAKAKNDGMTAIAVTDHGNMFGVKEFHNEAMKHGLKPILGCEVYIARRSRFEKSEKQDGGGFHLVLLAKNKQGYKNLIKLVSYGWTEGFYYKPRIDKELLKQYHAGLIALTACLHGELPWVLRNEEESRGLEVIQEYKSIFGEDYYFELQRHKSGDPLIDKEVYEDQVFVNTRLLKLAKETGTKVVATNDVHFINEEDADAHDRLLCISTGKDIDDPDRLRYTHQEWMKTQQEMKALFADIPEAIINTNEIVDKVETYELNSDPIMPDFQIPEGFADSNEYLRHLTYEGAAQRYTVLDEKVKERIEFELDTIRKMGFPGYFLIVWDVIRAAREMNVSVGPGRGSAAGSVVAYCLRITDIDPIKYDLLFERFLNPDRISMPDIDIDFDEDGREKVLQYVVKKYGEKRVAHIITFGTMAPKMAIRDVARVQKLPLQEADRLAKLVPEVPGISFRDAYEKAPMLLQERESGNEQVTSTLKYAEVLEGSVRQTGVHACGIIIGKDDLEEYIPICRNKDAELNVTQFDGSHIESVGMLKMDFLGLKTLSIIKDTILNVKISRNIDVDINAIPLDDSLTYELYSRGDTTGLFQFESDGMKKYLKILKPNRFEDLIAMNALYRPGPMDYIPSYVNRKHGREKIEYDISLMEVYLKDTYGITVYQEQVMLLSQLLAGFSKGMADSLRKAMGKKIVSMMDQLKVKFQEGCTQRGHDPEVVEKIWKDWESFAHYAFNKSHSTCYAYISYQTAYLKAHYPAEFMAAVLSRNLNDIKKITFFMDECRRMGLTVLVPDINESFSNFTVNTSGQIRFGLAAIKGVGESAVEHILEVRRKSGPYKSIYDVVERVNLTIVNKRCLEALAQAGGFDSFGEPARYEFFARDENGMSFIEQLIRYGNLMQSQGNVTQTLFGDMSAVQVVKPKPSQEEEWPALVKLSKEKELIGIYLSAHPLDNYRIELNHFCNATLSELRDLSSQKGRDLTIAGIVTSVKNAIAKNGKPYGGFTLEDYTDTYTFTFFGKDYENFRNYLYEGYSLLIKGSVQENTWKSTPEPEFRVKSICLLSNARDELIKNIQLRLPLDELSENLLDKLKSFTEGRKGNINLKVTLVDVTENIAVDLFSRSKHIELSDEFVDFLFQNPEIEFKLC